MIKTGSFFFICFCLWLALQSPPGIFSSLPRDRLQDNGSAADLFRLASNLSFHPPFQLRNVQAPHYKSERTNGLHGFPVYIFAKVYRNSLILPVDTIML